MKFHKPETVQAKDKEIVVRRSLCGCFTIVCPSPDDYENWHLSGDDKYVLRESMATIGNYRTIKQARLAAIKEAEDKDKVWNYFVERAEYEIKNAKRNVRDKQWLKFSADMAVDNARKAVIQTVTERAQETYNYLKHRAFLMTGPNSMAWSKRIDPAAWRDWNAMLEGTYVQWWEDTP